MNSVHYMFIQIEDNSIPKYLFIIAYRRPVGYYFQDFIEQYDLYSHQYSSIIILGDLNCDLLKTNNQSNHLYTFINEYSLSDQP